MARTFLWEPAPGADRFAIPVPFDPKAVFGKLRAPVIVTIGGHCYRSTITNMGGSPWVPFRKSHRAAARLPESGGVEVTLALDEAERTVAVPDDLAAALDALPGARAAWDALSFTRRREHVEGIIDARRAETRAKRIGKALDTVRTKMEL